MRDLDRVRIPWFENVGIFGSRPRRSIVSAAKKKGYPHPNPENQETTALSSSITVHLS